MADFTNITLPNGEVVPMYSPAAPGAEPGFDDVGAYEGFAPPPPDPNAPLTPEQRAVYAAVSGADEAGTGRAHAAPAPTDDPLAGASFDAVAPYDPSKNQGAGMLQDLPEPVAQPQRAAPGRLVKGGPQKTDWTVQPGADISGERIDAIEGSYDQRIENREQALADRVLGDEARYIAEEEALNKRRDQLEAQRARRLEIDSEINRLSEQRDQAQRQVEEAGQTDMPRLMGTSAIALIAGIGDVLGADAERRMAIAMGQVPPKQDLTALRDVFDQHFRQLQREYEQAQDSASVADNRYKEALDLYGDPESARKAIEAQDMGIAENWIAIQAQQAQDAQQQASMQDLADQLKQEKEMKLAELEDMTATKTTERWQQMPDRWVGGGGGAGAGKGPKPGSSGARAAAEAENALTNAREAVKYFQSLKAEGEETLPGYSIPGRLAKGVATTVAGPAGKTRAQATVDKHINSVAMAKRKPGDSSDVDQDRLRSDAIGDGSVDYALNAAIEAEKNARRTYEAASGQAPAEPVNVPGARR